MAGMGPPPKPAGTRARQNRAPQTSTLPAAGRDGKTPPWPLMAEKDAGERKLRAELVVTRLRRELRACDDGRVRPRLERELAEAVLTRTVERKAVNDQAAAERKLWAELWQTPQAVMWEKYGWSREVATYVRWQIKNEAGDLDAAKEARQWSDRLGLNPLAMLRLRWEIERTAEAETRGRQRRDAPAAPAAPSQQPKTSLDPRGFLSVVN